ncbi:MAG: hypothetical protein ACK4N5_04560 [Myxococcales bacterium]
MPALVAWMLALLAAPAAALAETTERAGGLYRTDGGTRPWLWLVAIAFGAALFLFNRWKRRTPRPPPPDV